MGRVSWVISSLGPALAGWALVTAVGCGLTDEQPADDAPKYFCDEFCSKRTRCGESVGPYCRIDCEKDPWSQAIEPHLLVAVTDCLTSRSCAVLYDDATWEECFDSSSDAVVRTDACYDFCDAYGADVFECGGAYYVDEAQQQCIEEWGCRWSDAILARASSCLESNDCAKRSACLERTWAL
jgi:hypothetical protein